MLKSKGKHRKPASGKIRRILAAAGIGALAVSAVAAPAGASVTHHHHHKRHAMTCEISDYGAIAQIGAGWYICDPAGRGYTWQAMPANVREMAT